MNKQLGTGATESKEALPQVPPRSAGRTVGEPPVQQRISTRRPVVIAVAVLLLLATAGGIWWSIGSDAAVR